MIIDTEEQIVHNDKTYQIYYINESCQKYFCEWDGSDYSDNEWFLMTDKDNNIISDNNFATDAFLDELYQLYHCNVYPIYICPDAAYGYGCLVEQNYFED